MVPAIVLIAVGAIFLPQQLHIFYFHDVWRYWPVILIAVGLVKLVDSPDNSGRTGGAILLVLGAIFLAAQPRVSGTFRSATCGPCF